MKLHWSPKSPYVRKVMVCVHELGLGQRIDCVRTVAAMAQPNAVLMQDNPLSKIPALVLDDGSVLFDSLVICDYLDHIATGRLFPSPGTARWHALRWHALGNGLTDLLILWRNERERTAPLPALTAAFEHKTWACLDRLEDETPALAAGGFTIGAIAVCCALGYADYRFDALSWRSRAPRLAQWLAVQMQRPSLQQTAPSDA